MENLQRAGADPHAVLDRAWHRTRGASSARLLDRSGTREHQWLRLLPDEELSHNEVRAPSSCPTHCAFGTASAGPFNGLNGATRGLCSWHRRRSQVTASSQRHRLTRVIKILSASRSTVLRNLCWFRCGRCRHRVRQVPRHGPRRFHVGRQPGSGWTSQADPLIRCSLAWPASEPLRCQLHGVQEDVAHQQALSVGAVQATHDMTQVRAAQCTARVLRQTTRAAAIQGATQNPSRAQAGLSAQSPLW